MRRYVVTFVLSLCCTFLWGQSNQELLQRIEKLENDIHQKELSNINKFRLGVYGEAVFSRRFYSNSWQRYTRPDLYKNGEHHGRVDIPHFVLMMDYDFGKGWKFGTELEFEHGGVGAAVEIEAEETGEYESEIEKGGEFVIEQMWIEKTFSPALNLRMGHIIVPVGGINMHHLPIQFFGNYRPEGESTIIPCTWHQTGISLWGKVGDWRYEAQLLPGLDAYMFDDDRWVGKGATSPFEFKVANNHAGMLRVDNYSVKGLRMGVSGYLGRAGNNSLKQNNYKDIDGMVGIVSFDFSYILKNVILRGSTVYGTMTDSEEISRANMHNRKSSPSPKDRIAKSAGSVWLEVGYNLFNFITNKKIENQKLYMFGRYNYYDSMLETESSIFDDKRFKRNCYAIGVNYFPTKEIVIKAEYTSRTFDKPYNSEPAFNLGVAFTGFLVK